MCNKDYLKCLYLYYTAKIVPNSWVERFLNVYVCLFFLEYLLVHFEYNSLVQSGLIVVRYWPMLAPSNAVTLFQKSYSKGFNIHFKTEEESEAFHCTFEQLKKEGSIKGAVF